MCCYLRLLFLGGFQRSGEKEGKEEQQEEEKMQEKRKRQKKKQERKYLEEDENKTKPKIISSLLLAKRLKKFKLGQQIEVRIFSFFYPML